MWTNIAPQPDIQNYVNNINAIGIPKLGPAQEGICPACIQAKSHQQSVNRQPSPRATAPYMLVVIDDWKGPCPSVTGAQHLFGAVGSYTGVKPPVELVRQRHTLYTLMTDRKPDLPDLYVFGCVA
eukprot:jgi/Tetstr1/429941/TSEL_019804.t1